jgi:hypothetical protein
VKHLFQKADMTAVTLHAEEERAVMQNKLMEFKEHSRAELTKLTFLP